MPYKKRSYYKHEEAKARDYSLFVIACEDTKTEPVIHVLRYGFYTTSLLI